MNVKGLNYYLSMFLRFERRMIYPYLLFGVFFLHVSYAISDDRLKGGLFFQSGEVDKDKRTSLNLTPDKALDLSEGFIIEFDLCLRSETQSFGYVFRLIMNDTLNIDLLSDITSEETNYTLIAKNRTLVGYLNDEIGFVPETWFKVKLRVDPFQNTIDISLNGVEKTVQYATGKPKRFRAYFGGITQDNFATTDIAPMTVRDIRISDLSSHPIRYWKLTSHGHNVVYDECKYDKATTNNPLWIIDSHVNWSKRASFILPEAHYSMTFDQDNDRIFIVKGKKILTYHVRSHTTDTIKVLHGIPFNTEFSQLEYDPVKKELISYHFESNRLATFNFNTLTWNNENDSVIVPRYWHHSNYYQSSDSVLLSVCGYGFHRYNSILQKYSLATGAWESHPLSTTITPRYLGAMGYIGNNKILYFGGFGNESGRQAEFPRNYYDLFTVDVNTMTAQKIWELPNPCEHFTNSNSLVINHETCKFYALAYPNKRYASVIKLHEYSMDNPVYQVVGDSIPYFFNDIESYCDLYQRSDSAELLAIVSFIRNNLTEINIYSIAFPILKAEEIIQYQMTQTGRQVWRRLVIPAVLVVLLFFFIFIFRKRLGKRMVAKNIENKPMPDNEAEPFVNDTLIAEKKRASVYLLGNFQVIDDNGNEITKNFTPTTTQLFLLLLMSTAKNGKGITSKELRNILWFDKEDDSARNNRNVYIAKLRSIMKTFTQIKIENDEGYWTVQSEKTVFCDYERALVLIKMLQTAGERFNKKLLTELVDIALRGTLLPYVKKAEWLEPYQTDYSNLIIECLMRYIRNDALKNDLLLLLKIADVILLHDNIDEDAIRLKCYALLRSGRKNQALQAFNKFTTNYESLLAAKHNLVFDELVKW